MLKAANAATLAHQMKISVGDLIMEAVIQPALASQPIVYGTAVEARGQENGKGDQGVAHVVQELLHLATKLGIDLGARIVDTDGSSKVGYTRSNVKPHKDGPCKRCGHPGHGQKTCFSRHPFGADGKRDDSKLLSKETLPQGLTRADLPPSIRDHAYYSHLPQAKTDSATSPTKPVKAATAPARTGSVRDFYARLKQQRRGGGVKVARVRPTAATAEHPSATDQPCMCIDGNRWGDVPPDDDDTVAHAMYLQQRARELVAMLHAPAPVNMLREVESCTANATTQITDVSFQDMATELVSALPPLDVPVQQTEYDDQSIIDDALRAFGVDQDEVAVAMSRVELSFPLNDQERATIQDFEAAMDVVEAVKARLDVTYTDWKDMARAHHATAAVKTVSTKRGTVCLDSGSAITALDSDAGGTVDANDTIVIEAVNGSLTRTEGSAKANIAMRSKRGHAVSMAVPRVHTMPTQQTILSLYDLMAAGGQLVCTAPDAMHITTPDGNVVPCAFEDRILCIPNATATTQ